MSRFANLLLRSDNPADVQRRAELELPLVLSRSNLHFWRLGEIIISDTTRFLVGVATWSLYDLRLLDALDAEFANGNRVERVDVFDIDSCRTQEDVSAFIPNIGKVFDAPVVGVWRNELQIKHASGYEGRKLLVEAFGLDHKKIVALANAG